MKIHLTVRNVLCTLLCVLPCLPVGAQDKSLEPPAGFGRFGRINEDGLLTLNVSPQGFATPPTATTFRGQFGDGQITAKVTQIDTTAKSLRLTGGGNGAPQSLTWSLLYPGFSAKFGMAMELRLRGTTQGAPVEFEVIARSNVPFKGASPWILVRQRSRRSVPLLLIFPSSAAPKVSLQREGRDTLLKGTSPKNIGTVLFCTPVGLREEMPQARILAACEEWAKRAFPVRQSSRYQLAPDGKSVYITETFRNTSGSSLSPLPPVLAFALQNGYPAKVLSPLVRTDCQTKWGDFAFVKGRTLRYVLPVPPTEEHGYLRTEEKSNRPASLLPDSFVGHLGGDWVKNGVDLGYAGMANAQMAWVWLSSANQREVMAAWRTYLPQAFRMPPYPSNDTKQTWKREKEPFTGQPYLWTYFIKGPETYKYDIEWGNALPLYGLYKYAQYTGDWSLVRKNWTAVQRIFRYIHLGDDWAWMTVVNTDYGYSTGTGDPMAAAYCGALACLKMARVLGDRKAEALYSCRTARIAVPTVARLWYTKWARLNGYIGPKSVVLGFHETEGYTRARLAVDDPWDVSSVLSGDGIQPELFDAFLAFGRKGLQDFEQMYAQGFPAWYKADHKYPFTTTYNGNSIYVTFPHIYARAVLGEPTETLWKYAAAAETNRNNAWVGPNVLAELLSRSAPLLLTEWQPAAYKEGVVSSDGHQVTLDFVLAGKTDWTMTATLKTDQTPSRVTLNGVEVPFTLRNRRLTLRHTVSGSVKVVLLF